ncbi:MAG: DMT family transporter [Aquamicrobium sp.]|uniref:DMT family transporter n=1 Tax=Aquamicrobium sp. TaxID=1872579 RepID=UPI00349EC43A|nr:DMT family transporter [Aquamicrobium sp.]MCO5158442.1 DMT family transporter [Aquamicrobium sp.]
MTSFPISISRHELALVSITMVWGATFLIVQWAMQHSGALFFVGVRFLIAGAMAALVFRKAMRGLTWREVKAGTAIGTALFLGYALQSHGLKTITSSQSAFITALYVPMVPLLQWLVLRRRPSLMSWIGIGLAFVGLALLAGPDAGHLTLSAGEVVTLVGALAIAAEIIMIGGFASGVDSRRVTAVQLLAGGTMSLAAMPLVGEAVPAFHWVWFSCAVGLGLASALIQLTMNWAQKVVPPTRATLIYAGEPVWGGIFGRIAGDRLPPLALLGGALIVAAVIVSEWRPRAGMWARLRGKAK